MHNTYERELASLAAKHPGRNAALLRLALLGLAAGRTPSVLAAEIIAAGGEPRLTDNEVNRAIEKAIQRRSQSTNWKPSHTHRKTVKPQANEKRQNFVRSMIALGGGKGRFDDLKALSKPGNILAHVLQPDKLYFFGNAYDRRTRDHLMTPVELAQKLIAGAPCPTLFTPNPFTGKKGLNDKGEESYCLDCLIAERTLALIEFDALPLEEQVAFWLGVIRDRKISVASLVFSGNKSIHGLIRVLPDNWAKQWRDCIEVLMASDPDPRYRCDVACKNAGRMTRFPGGRNPKNNGIQELLFLG